MKYSQLLFLFIVISCSAHNPVDTSSHWTGVDSICIENIRNSDLANLADYGRKFLGTPYVASVLEVGNDSSAIVNLHQLDCTTFVETVLSLYIASSLNPEDYSRALEKVRYRDGVAKGYASRLHYLTDWIRNNQKKGILRDMTESLGGIVSYKTIDFMSKHRDKYSHLQSEENFQKILKVEEKLQNECFHYIPKGKLRRIESFIKNGDIIVITTQIDGLDVSHLGIATRQKPNGRVHLLHASSSAKKVVISHKPLVEYLMGNRRQEGVIVLRVD